MNNSKIEIKFLNDIKQYSQINLINTTNEDISKLISNIEYQEELDKKGGPDYVYETYLFEKFSIDSSKRTFNPNNKKYSIQKAKYNQMKHRAKYRDEIFNIVTFSARFPKTNVRYLKENLLEMIKQKTYHLGTYKKNYPTGDSFNLIIEIETICEVYTNDKGEFFSDETMDTDELKLVPYRICKDFNLISKIKKEYSPLISLIIFVERINSDTILSCIDLRNEIVKDKMETYPDKILQIVLGDINQINMQSVSNTNIQYIAEEPLINECHEMIINGINMHRMDEYSYIYVDEQELLYFEATQKLIALNPTITDVDILRYFGILLCKQLTINFNNKQIKLERSTPLNGYLKLNFNGGLGLFKVNNDRNLVFKFNEIPNE